MPIPGISWTRSPREDMLDLYTESYAQIRIYHHRLPNADGGNPNANKLGVAYGSLAVLFLASLNLLDFGFDDPLVWYKWTLFGLLAAGIGGWIVTQYFQLVFCGRTRRLYVSYLLFTRTLARFDDLGEIRIRLGESGGALKGFYVALWRGNPLKRPLVLSPGGKTVNQLSHYRHNIIPKVKTMIWGDLGEDAPTEVATDTVSINTAARPDPDQAALNATRKKNAKQSSPAPGKAYKASFWLDVWLEFPAGLAVIAAVAALFTLAERHQAAMTNRVQDAIFLLVFLFVLKYAGYVLCLMAAARLFGRVARRNVTILVDPVKRQIRFRTMFGLREHINTFDSLIELTIKYRWGRETLCVVLEGQYADPAVHIGFFPASTRRHIDLLCGTMGIDPRVWVDVLSPTVRYSASYKRRIMHVFNPYYEK